MALEVPQDLDVGSEATVRVVNSSRAGQTIDVIITNEEGDRQELSINLDEFGNGQADWPVEAWNVVHFNYSTCPEVTRYPVQQPA